MKNTAIQILTGTTFLLSLFTCANPSKQSSNEEKTIEVYTVLVEKAITLQADLDLEAWADMLADDVVYSFPDDGAQNQTTLVGKPAVLVYWQNWREKHHIKSFSFTGFSHAPFLSTKNLNIYSLSGVYVFSIFMSKMVFDNDETVELFMNYCCHFNKDKRIDRCYTYYDRTPMIKVITRLSLNSMSQDMYLFKRFRSIDDKMENGLWSFAQKAQNNGIY